MSKVIDKRKQAMGGHSKRQVKHIRNTAVHYSATKEGSTAAFERFWKGKGWITGGYHEVILTNGDVELNYDPTVITNGVLGHNTSTYNICYVGDGQPNSKQLKTLRKRVKRAKSAYKIKDSNIKGHREFRGASTSCPALNVKSQIVEHIKGGIVDKVINVVTPKPKQTAPRTKGYTARIQRRLNTYSFNNIAVDDIFGPATHRALIKVYQYELNKQLNAGLVVDGIPGPATDAAAVVIRYGAQGNLTRAMQAMLYFKGYKVSVDGVFGDITLEMVKVYQRKSGLKADGVPGPVTFRKLIRR